MVAAVELERWRSYFGKAGADIWTVIQQAINIAAMDYPEGFRERRGEIAETLFARSLLMMHARDDQDDLNARSSKTRHAQALHTHVEESTPAYEEGELIESETGGRLTSKTMSGNVVCDEMDDHDEVSQLRHHDQAEALSDELEEETLLIRELDGIKATIMDGDQPETVVLEVLQGLQCMDITVGALKATEIGKHVNCLRKHPSKRVRAVVKDIVRQWKVLVDMWVSGGEDVAAAAVTDDTAADPGDGLVADDQEEGLALSPLDEDALIDARVSSMDVSQLFSFMDEDMCTGNNGNHKSSWSVEPSVKDNLKILSRSLSGSTLTDSSDFDTKVSSNHPWGHHGTPEERGSATRDMYPPSGKLEMSASALKGRTGQKAQKGSNSELGIPASKGITTGSGPGRPTSEASKGPVQGGKLISDHNGVSRSHVIHSTMAAYGGGADKLSNTKSDKKQVDQKLEIAKRKLHQGYQQAENAKKQRTIQVLSFPDLPKTGGGGQPVKGKANQSVQNKAVPPSQNRAAFYGAGHHGSSGQSRRMA